MNLKNIPEELREDFEHKDINFVVSKFEEMYLQDIFQFDEQARIKLNRNVTQIFIEEFNLYYEQKRNIRYTIKGGTRSGKSLIGLKIMDMAHERVNINFAEKCDYYVCGNQIEYRQKLKNAKFGEFYLVDENFFNRSGLGSAIESTQLTDYNNVIAKKNIGVVFITPQKFLNIGAVLGMDTFGRDDNNWLSRVLVYMMKGTFSKLIGYVVFDIGDLFRKHGCFVYKSIGGCVNSKRLEAKDIPQKFIKHSYSIPQEYSQDFSILDKTIKRTDEGEIINCPFYEVCTHPICKYEHKKDTWIDKEMTGGLDERTYERFKLALELLLDLEPTIVPENNVIRVRAKNGKDLKNKVRLQIHKHTNSKLGIAEFDELLEIIKSNTNINMLVTTLCELNIPELSEKFFSLEQGMIIKSQYEQEISLRLQKQKEEQEEQEQGKDT